MKISGNKILTLSVTDSLSTCPALRHLYLHQNPIDKAPSYHVIIPALLPQITHLDGKKIDLTAVKTVSNSMILEAASVLTQLSEEMEEERRFEMSIFDAEPDFGDVPEPTQSSFPDTGSELTFGHDMVLAGSASISIRRRKNRVRQDLEDETPLNFLERAALEPDIKVTSFLSDGEESRNMYHSLTPLGSPESKRPLSSQRPVSSPEQLNASRPQSVVPIESHQRGKLTRKNSGFSPPLQVVHVEEALLSRPKTVFLPAHKFDSVSGELSSSSESEEEASFGGCYLSEGEDNVGRSRSHRSEKLGLKLGIDLDSSLLAISDWAKHMEESEDSDDSEASPLSRRAMVLSRERILSMVK